MPSLPTSKSASISFVDADNTAGEISGDLQITKAPDETNISHYVLYWGTDEKTRMCTSSNCGTNIAKTGANLTYSFSGDTQILSDGSDTATHLIVYTKNESGESSIGTSLEIVDLK